MKRTYSSNRARRAGADDELNPMDGVTNLADVMLVLAVGIMLALVINWNIDISPKGTGNAQTPPSYVQINPSGTDSDGTVLDPNAQYEEVNVKVYRDPTTGEMFMVQIDENEAGN
ncbi:MAG: DUF2149 domain-containing protein [Oscillospiraceae bacterium]|jgi:hypothetical protein|nr:DUF2149 domain-containing protein [Oscillospiraceae bacterium]